MMTRLYDTFRKLNPLQRDMISFFILTVLIVIVYGQTIVFKYCIDDQYYLWLFNDQADSLKDHFSALLQRFWGSEYRPITFLTLLLESLIFGGQPKVHHIFNLIYYLMLCFSIYKFCLLFFKKFEIDYYLISLGIAILFLVHTSHANVVSSIKNRETILSLFFGILALCAWLKFVEQRKFYLVFLSLSLLLIGIYAKRDIIPFLFIIPLVGWIYDQNSNLRVFGVSFLILFFGAIIGTSVVQNFIAAGSRSEFAMQAYENILVAEPIEFLERIPFAFDILFRYEKFMVWPFNYYFYFGYDVIPILTQWKPYIIVLFVGHILLLSWIVYCLLKRKKKYLIGPLIFYLSIAPFVLSLVTGYIAVRYSFIASFGFCISLVQIYYCLYQSITQSKWKHLVFIFFILLMSSLAFLARQRSFAWKDIGTLYATDIPHISRSANANRMACLYYYIIAEEEDNEYIRDSLIRKSNAYCDQALSIYDVPIALEYKARGFELLGQFDKALPLYEKLLEMESNNREALRYLAFHYKHNNDLDKSIVYFEQLINNDPHNIEAYIELTQIYNAVAMYDRAIDINRKLYDWGAEYDALLNFGDIFIASGDTLIALMNYNSAIQIKREPIIMEQVLRISKEFGNDTMVYKIKNML
ncbi:MAG: tetratricopeptide repeat protein [Chitinophagales bacterium]